MPAQPASDADTDEIGQRIERAAAELFIRDGFEGTSTADIARLAATSKRSIYDRFPNKEALFGTVMAYLCALPGDDPGPGDAATDSLDDRLERIAMAVLVRFAQPETMRVFASAVAQLPKTEAYVRVFWSNGPGAASEQLAAILDDAAGRGEIRLGGEKPEDLARLLIMDCCGPLVLRQLFFPAWRAERAELRRIAADAVARFRPSLA